MFEDKKKLFWDLLTCSKLADLNLGSITELKDVLGLVVDEVGTLAEAVEAAEAAFEAAAASFLRRWSSWDLHGGCLTKKG